MSNGITVADEVQKSAANCGEEERKHTVAEQRHPAGRTLASLLEGVDVRSAVHSPDLQIRQVACDSRKVQPGALFVAVHGVATDGNIYAKDAASRGAVVVLSENPAPADWTRDVAWVQLTKRAKPWPSPPRISMANPQPR